MPGIKRRGESPAENGQSSLRRKSEPASGRLSTPDKQEDKSSVTPPCLRLPDEILLIILSMAFDEVHSETGCGYYPKNAVGNVLCVCSQFNRVDRQHVYRLIKAKDKRIIELGRRFESNPRDWQGVREIVFDFEANQGDQVEMFFKICKKIQHLIRISSSPHRTLDRLQVNLPAKHGLRLAKILVGFRPRQVEWRNDPIPMCESFAGAIANDTAKHQWLSQVESLHLSHFHMDSDTILLISHLPKLATLTLTENCGVNEEVHAGTLTAILSADILRTDLKKLKSLKRLFVYEPDVELRQEIERDIGVCILVESPRGPRAFSDCIGTDGPGKRIWHGCQNTRIVRQSTYPHHKCVVPTTSSIPCPRCCVLDDRWEYEGPAVPVLTWDLEDAKSGKPLEARFVPFDEPRITGPFRYGLCDLHYEEIFGDKSAKDEKTLLRKKALECVRWFM